MTITERMSLEMVRGDTAGRKLGKEKRLRVTMRLEGAAFEDCAASETARILRGLADDVEMGHTVGSLHDANGNTVGTWSIK